MKLKIILFALRDLTKYVIATTLLLAIVILIGAGLVYLWINHPHFLEVGGFIVFIAFIIFCSYDHYETKYYLASKDAQVNHE